MATCSDTDSNNGQKTDHVAVDRSLSLDLRLRFGIISAIAIACFGVLLALDNFLARQHVHANNSGVILHKAEQATITISQSALTLEDRSPAARRELSQAVTDLRLTAAKYINVRNSPLGFVDDRATARMRHDLLRWANAAEAAALAFAGPKAIDAQRQLKKVTDTDLLKRIEALGDMKNRRADLLHNAEHLVRLTGLVLITALLALIWLIVIRPLVARQQIVLKRMKRNEHTARALAAQTARADEAKSNFLSVISHELRTPMNGILGCAELIRTTTVDEKSRRLANTICDSGGDLNSILSDILDFTELKAGALDLIEGAIYTEQLSEDVDETFCKVAAAGNTRLEVTLLGDPDRPRVGDMTRLIQLVSKLVDNAVRFSEGGAVFVTIDNRFVSGLRICVRDTGDGMTPPEVARAFNPFTQGDAGDTRSLGGAGMGLTMVKKLTDAMGGDVRLESRKGAGTTVIVVIPLRFADSQDLETIEARYPQPVEPALEAMDAA